jgi:hypothetical protein
VLVVDVVVVVRSLIPSVFCSLLPSSAASDTTCVCVQISLLQAQLFSGSKLREQGKGSVSAKNAFATTIDPCKLESCDTFRL